MTLMQMVNMLDGQLSDAHDEIDRLKLALSTARNDALDEAAELVWKREYKTKCITDHVLVRKKLDILALKTPPQHKEPS